MPADYETDRSNLNEPAWVKEQIKNELTTLGSSLGTTLDKFYVEDTANATLTCKMDVVTNYLKHLQTTYPTWNDLITHANSSTGNSSAWIMSVQIALESIDDDKYNVGTIDGIFKKGGKTEGAVRQFQEDWNTDHPSDKIAVDGVPGPQTIAKILEVLDVPAVVGPKTGVKVKQGESLTAEELIDNLPSGAKATFDGTPDFNTLGNQTIKVKVEDGSGNAITGSPFACSYEVVDTLTTATPKETIETTKSAPLKAEDFFEDPLPTGTTVKFDGTPDFNTIGTKTARIIITDAKGDNPIDLDYDVHLITRDDLNKIGSFGTAGFTLNTGVEKEDGGKHYIEIGGTQYYSVADNPTLTGKGYKIYSDYIYIGELVNGNLEGEGEMYYSDKNYFGNYKDDCLNGQGTHIYNGAKDYGDYDSDQLTGNGKRIYDNGNVFTGVFEKDAPKEGEKGTFILKTLDSSFDAKDLGKYEVTRDTTGLKITDDGGDKSKSYNGRYINTTDWKIEDLSAGGSV